MRDSWQGSLVDAKRHIALQYKRPGDVEFQWGFGLHAFKDSSVLIWPCALREFKGYGKEFLWPEPVLDVQFTVLITLSNILDTSTVQGSCFTWWSPMKQKSEGLGHLVPSTRAFLDHRPESLVILACKHAWWSGRDCNSDAGSATRSPQTVFIQYCLLQGDVLQRLGNPFLDRGMGRWPLAEQTPWRRWVQSTQGAKI